MFSYRKKIILILVLFLSLVKSSLAFANQKITIAGQYWCPYNCEPGTEEPGYLIELLQRTLAVHDIEVEYVLMPWHKALKAFEDKEIDGIAGVSSLQEYQMVSLAKPIVMGDLAVYSLKPDYKFYNIESLNGRRIGLVYDYSLTGEIANYFSINYLQDPSRFVLHEDEYAIENGFKDLIHGEIDVLIEDSQVIEQQIDKMDAPVSVYRAGAIMASVPIYIGFRPDTPNIAQILRYLDSGLAAFQSSGEEKFLKKKYKME